MEQHCQRETFERELWIADPYTQVLLERYVSAEALGWRLTWC
jgi:hypothetical protein